MESLMGLELVAVAKVGGGIIAAFFILDLLMKKCG